MDITKSGERWREGRCLWQQEVFEPPPWGTLFTSLVVSVLMGIRNGGIGSFLGIQSKKSGKRQDVYWRSGLDTQLFPYRPQWSILIAKKKNEFAMQNKYIYLHDFLLSFPLKQLIKYRLKFCNLPQTIAERCPLEKYKWLSKLKNLGYMVHGISLCVVVDWNLIPCCPQ